MKYHYLVFYVALTFAVYKPKQVKPHWYQVNFAPYNYHGKMYMKLDSLSECFDSKDSAMKFYDEKMNEQIHTNSASMSIYLKGTCGVKIEQIPIE